MSAQKYAALGLAAVAVAVTIGRLYSTTVTLEAAVREKDRLLAEQAEALVEFQNRVEAEALGEKGQLTGSGVLERVLSRVFAERGLRGDFSVSRTARALEIGVMAGPWESRLRESFADAALTIQGLPSLPELVQHVAAALTEAPAPAWHGPDVKLAAGLGHAESYFIHRLCSSMGLKAAP
eukprot:EG_transcript_25399